jgi:hypothetical protein
VPGGSGSDGIARAARPLVERDLGPLHPDLPRHVIHCSIGNLGPATRESTPLGIEAQQQREAQLRRSTLPGDKLQLIADKCPAVDQLVLVNLAPHARKLHPLPTRHAEISVCTG